MNLAYKHAAALFSDGRFNEAEAYINDALQSCKEILGAEHPNTSDLHGRLGFDIWESETLEGGRRLGRASDGDEKEGVRARASRHTDQHEQPCLDLERPVSGR